MTFNLPIGVETRTDRRPEVRAGAFTARGNLLSIGLRANRRAEREQPQMPKKKTANPQSVDQRGFAPTQGALESKNACGGGRQGDEADRRGGPTKGKDDWYWPRPPALTESRKSQGVTPREQRGSRVQRRTPAAQAAFRDTCIFRGLTRVALLTLIHRQPPGGFTAGGQQPHARVRPWRSMCCAVSQMFRERGVLPPGRAGSVSLFGSRTRAIVFPVI